MVYRWYLEEFVITTSPEVGLIRTVLRVNLWGFCTDLTQTGLCKMAECTEDGTGLMVRASDSGSGDPGSILGRVGVFVSLSKRHLLPKSTGNTQE